MVYRVLAAEGSRILGATVSGSVLSRNCVVQSGSVVEESIIGQGVVIGRNCRIKRAIIDSHNYIADNTVIGEDPEEDAKNHFVDPHSGLVTLGMPRILYQKESDEKAMDSFSWSTFS